MRISKLKEIIADMPDETLVFVLMFEKDEAQDHLTNNCDNWEGLSISDEQWAEVVSGMDTDENMWSEISECWKYYLEKINNKVNEVEKIA